MRLHISLDDELVRQIDQHAGPRGRSRFIREAIERTLEAHRQREALLQLAGAAPDFASHLPDDWIREGREWWTRESERRTRSDASSHGR
jgi:predicted transcriptional regulator